MLPLISIDFFASCALSGNALPQRSVVRRGTALHAMPIIAGFIFCLCITVLATSFSISLPLYDYFFDYFFTPLISTFALHAYIRYTGGGAQRHGVAATSARRYATRKMIDDAAPECAI